MRWTPACAPTRRPSPKRSSRNRKCWRRWRAKASCRSRPRAMISTAARSSSSNPSPQPRPLRPRRKQHTELARIFQRCHNANIALPSGSAQFFPRSFTMSNPEQNVPANSTNANTNNPGDNTQKDPKDWVTGDEPATGAQRSYLKTLAQETGEQVPEDLTKAEASEKIDELKQIDPRTSGK